MVGRRRRAAHAFLWQDGVMTDLGTLGGTQPRARPQRRGQVVGHSRVAAPPAIARLPLGGRRDDRPHAGAGPPRPTGSTTRARWSARNNHGPLPLGGRRVHRPRPLRRRGTSSARTSTTPGKWSARRTSRTRAPSSGPCTHAFLWQDGVMTDLGVLPGDEESGATRHQQRSGRSSALRAAPTPRPTK